MTQERPAGGSVAGSHDVRTRVRRVICAEPTSTALLLAGPGALELWPGARQVRPAGRRGTLLAELLPSGAVLPADPVPPAGAVLPGVPVAQATEVAVRALPPRRTASAYVSRFSFSGPGLPLTRGTLTLGYVSPFALGAAGRGPAFDVPVTQAVLMLLTAAQPGSPPDELRLRRMAAGFLANLGAAAEARSQAA